MILAFLNAPTVVFTMVPAFFNATTVVFSMILAFLSAHIGAMILASLIADAVILDKIPDVFYDVLA